MAYKCIGIAIYKYLYKISAHDIFHTVNKICRIYAWRNLSQLTLLFFLAKHAGNVRIR